MKKFIIFFVGIPFTLLVMIPLFVLNSILIVALLSGKLFERTSDHIGDLHLLSLATLGTLGLIGFWLWAITDIYNTHIKRLCIILVCVGTGLFEAIFFLGSTGHRSPEITSVLILFYLAIVSGVYIMCSVSRALYKVCNGQVKLNILFGSLSKKSRPNSNGDL